MERSLEVPFPQIAINNELERLCRALSKEQERAAGSIHFASSNLVQVESLYQALLLLVAAQTDTVKLLAAETSQTEALLIVGNLVSKLRGEMMDRWSRRQFRASEAVARTLTLVVAAENSIRHSGPKQVTRFETAHQ